MATLFEYYNTNDDNPHGAYDDIWIAQTFTPSIAHKITSVKLLLYRDGSPGMITVGIRATDGEGHPTGEDLCVGTTDGDVLTEDTAGLWYEITLGAGFNLNANTKYAIVARAPDGGGLDLFNWRSDTSDPTYAGGCLEYKVSELADWQSYDNDQMFEEWGTAEIEVAVDIGIALTASRKLTLAREASIDIGITPSADRQCVYHRYGWRP